MAGRDVPPLSSVTPVRWSDGRLFVIDQTRLPREQVELELTNVRDVAEAIGKLRVRGAPLLGIVAAYAVALQACQYASVQLLHEAIETLGGTRPTARNLFAALERQAAVIAGRPPDLPQALLAEARSIHDEDLAASAAIAAHAAAVLKERGWAMTICNTGALATGGGGTALALIVEGYRRSLLDGVYVCETRPLLQGARLTCWELSRLDVPFELLPDSAAASLLAAGRVSCAVVGADRIARNGDTANKVGTRTLAVLAQAHEVPFFVVAPRATFDATIERGAEIAIEQRNGSEVRGCGAAPLVPATYPVYNPGFDVTESQLISSFVTDAGVIAAAKLEESGLCS